MRRQAPSLSVSIKCRIGVDSKDSYDELKSFISTTHQGGVHKYIIHARKCLLRGLTPKQNRDIPPLKYDVVHRLQQDFPDMTFVLNGGILNLKEAKKHMNDEGYIHEDSSMLLPSVHGVMIGRAAFNTPLLFTTADSEIYGVADPCLTRREILERYMEYCDFILSDEGPSRLSSIGATQKVSTQVLLNAMRNVTMGMRGNARFRQALNDIYVKKVRELNSLTPDARTIIEGAMIQLQDHELDAPLGNPEPK